jgi:branched-chain amino acid transport system substrate-binding protein
MLHRRQFLKFSAFAAASLAAPGFLRSAFAAGGEITLAAPLPMSGAFASNGKYGSIGTSMAINDAGSILGRKLSYLELDTEGSSATAVRKVQDAMQQRHATLFAGGILSSTALAMSQEINKRDGVLFTTAGADTITGSKCNKATFRWSVPTYGAINETVRPLIDKMPNAKRWYTITPKYVFGEDLLSAAKDVFKEKGIQHVGNSYHSLDTQEFSGYITNALSVRPDVLLLLNFGSQSTACLRQAVNFGVKNRMTIVVAWASGLEQFKALGPDVVENVYFGAQYWHAIDSPFNKQLVAEVKKEKGINPDYALASAYMITKLLIDGARKAGSIDGPAVAKALEGMEYDGLTGKETIRAADHQVIKNYYLLKGKAKANMKDADDYVEIVNYGQSFRSAKQEQCVMG